MYLSPSPIPPCQSLATAPMGACCAFQIDAPRSSQSVLSQHCNSQASCGSHSAGTFNLGPATFLRFYCFSLISLFASLFFLFYSGPLLSYCSLNLCPLSPKPLRLPLPQRNLPFSTLSLPVIAPHLHPSHGYHCVLRLSHLCVSCLPPFRTRSLAVSSTQHCA